MIAGDRVGRRLTRLARLGLPGAIALLVLAAVNAAVIVPRPAAAARSGYEWVTSWSASPQDPMPGTLGMAGFHDQTVRDIIYPSVGGNTIRLELTNAFGRSLLEVGRVTVGVAGLGAGVVPGNIHPVSFGGRLSVRIPAGEQVLSDPVSMQVSALQELAVSIYLPGRTGRATLHSAAQQVNWVSTAGDHAAEAGADAFTIATASWYYLSGLDVRSSGSAGTLVAFGDSITDGVQSTVGGNDRWPNDLARRLDALAGPALAVADEGIGGNRVLIGSRCCGASAVARFARDALDQPGVRDVIVLEGINDIGFSVTPNTGCSVPNTNVTAAQIEAGYRQMISMAHADGLKILGATLTPFKGAGYWSPAGEAKREAVNNWIRTSHAFDGVIDFAKAVQDRFNPLYINPAYNSGDNLHPNDAGYEAMADAINLALLTS